MSIAASASRFACLPDDEAADWKAPKSKVKTSPTKVDANKKNNDNKPKDKAKAKAQQEAKALQNMAFGGQKKAKNKKKGKSGDSKEGSPVVSTTSSEPPAGLAPPEEWRERDEQAAEDSFSQAMQQAILLSQLEAERKAAAELAKAELVSNGAGPDTTEAELAELTKEERRRAVKAGKKDRTVSLDQFQAGAAEPLAAAEEAEASQPAVYKHPRFRDRAPGEKLEVVKSPKPQPVGAAPSIDPPAAAVNFFTQMEEAAAAVLTREQMRESFVKQEALGSESALVASYREKLLDKEAELVAARAEAAGEREKLGQAKARAKKLTEILMQAEMREKTEVLVQVHKLETVRDELSAQLAVTVAEQEQERSLVSALEAELRRAAEPGRGMEPDTATRLLATIRAVLRK